MTAVLPIVCPAARMVDPPPAGPRGGPTIICGVLENSNLAAVGRGPGKRRGEGDPTYRLDEPVARDGAPNQVQAFCCGAGIPGGEGHHAFDVPEGQAAPACSYTACSLWRGAREADWARKRLQGGELNVPGPAPVHRAPVEFDQVAA